MITLPVHPLRGHRLPVVREVMRSGGHYVEAEHPRGWRVLLPLGWTDRGVAPVAAIASTGEAVRVSVRQLLSMASALRVISQEGVDVYGLQRDDVEPPDLLSPVIDATPPATLASSELGAAVGDEARGRHRRVGDLDSGIAVRLKPTDGATS